MADNIAVAERVESSEGPEVLCRLLCDQIASARDGNLVQVEHLCAQAEDVVAGMKGDDGSTSLTDAQKTRLKQLYSELVLTLQAERADVGGKLRQLRQVKKAVGAYGSRRKPQPAGLGARTGGA